ncbi:precorrin-6y C5,15-methyltransferase (decarboxylating) subunit CbiE [Streptomyces sp. NPDC049954]|uniref:precorrin-6y C5,15-methyltransferase (decarboxylating) subunit CbiE n=1 Tax=Streptomyces sp. NPDC049954 TaxID=3155779 RepID=UPI003436E86D
MITVVGTGTGAPFDPDVRARLAAASLVVGAARHLEAAGLSSEAERIVLGPLAPALDTLAAHVAGGADALVLASGDPGFFGVVRVLAERFGRAALDVRPGVSSVAAAFARVGLPWEDAVVVSAHGRALRTAVNLCRAGAKTAVLTGPGAGPAELGAALLGWPERTLVVASALGDPERERVERLTPAQAAGREWDAVSVVLCLAPSALEPGPVSTVAGGPGAGSGPWALPEEEFGHRASMITKFEVRALALARLAPRPGDLVWDVGAGSGSVAVECARLGAAAVAVEKSADGVALVRRNAAAHGVGLLAVHGAAPAALAGLPDPDAVFVGGGGAQLPEILRACARRGPRTVVVAMAALERVPAARLALARAGYAVEGVQLQSSRLAPLPGGVTRLAAGNPVFLLWGERAADGDAARTEKTQNAEREGVTL